MSVACSTEFRREVLAASDSGKGTQEVALAFGVSEPWVRRIKQVRREKGQKETRNRKPERMAYKDRIIGIAEATPDISLSDLQTTLSRSTLCVALNRLARTSLRNSFE